MVYGNRMAILGCTKSARQLPSYNAHSCEYFRYARFPPRLAQMISNHTVPHRIVSLRADPLDRRSVRLVKEYARP